MFGYRFGLFTFVRAAATPELQWATSSETYFKIAAVFDKSSASLRVVKNTSACSHNNPETLQTTFSSKLQWWMWWCDKDQRLKSTRKEQRLSVIAMRSSLLFIFGFLANFKRLPASCLQSSYGILWSILMEIASSSPLLHLGAVLDLTSSIRAGVPYP